MYIPSPDASNLRQGDILAGIYLPRFSVGETQFLHKLKDDGSWEFQKHTVMKTEETYAAVISQCCEFNDGKRNSFTLAQLLRLSGGQRRGWKVFGFNLAQISPWRSVETPEPTPDELLKRNSLENDIQDVNVYFLKPDGVHFKVPYVIDFTRVFSVSMKEKPRVLKNKVLEFDNEHRLEFQEKLAYFYSRPALD